MRGKRRETGIIEDNLLIDKEEFNKIMENFINNIGHLNGTIPKDQFWLSSKGWIKKANCTKCKNAYIEDIWYEWMCKKAGRIPLDEEGFPVDCEFECIFFEEE